MKNNKALLISLALSLAVIVVSGRQISALFVWKYPPLNDLIVTENYSTDLGALGLGTHRMAADIGYIQLLQYYGQSQAFLDPREEQDTYQNEALYKISGKAPVQIDQEEHEEEHSDDHHDGDESSIEHAFKHDHFSAGVYRRLYQFAMRILLLDPFFNSAILESAGALAFNIKRPNEALALLEEAIKRDPTFHRYRLYLGAILYKEEKKEEPMIGLLEEAIQYSDCPPLLENILANLHIKFGNYKRAVEIYAHTIKTSFREVDRESAQRGVIKLLQNQPDLMPLVERLLQEE